MTSSKPVGNARVTLFGFDPTPARLDVIPRPVSWRLARVLRVLLVTAVAAPAAFLIPPHAPWGVGALVIGGFLARRRWVERFTIAAFRGHCPRCGAEVEVEVGSRLRVPHPVSCGGCRHDSALVVSANDLDRV